MKINNNINIQNNYNNPLKTANKEKSITSQKEVEENAENIKGSYNVAFFGLFRKKNLLVDARYVNASLPLEANKKYLISDDSKFLLGNYTLDLASEKIKPFIDGLKNKGSIIFGREAVNPYREMGHFVSDEHIKISKDKKGQLMVTNLSTPNRTFLMPNLVVPNSLDKPFHLTSGMNYLLPQNSILSLGNIIFPLNEHKVVIDALENGQSVIVGRGRNANISLLDTNISHQHIKLTKFNDEVLVKDLNSKNGISFIDIDRNYKADFSNIDKMTKLQRGVPTKVPNNSQLHLGYEMTIDMRNPHIINDLNNRGRITIGRSPKSDFVVSPFYNMVSGEHLILEKDGNEIIATDVSRTNGTVVIPKNAIQPFYGDLNNLSLNQGNIGDCYLLSSIYALSRNPRGQNILRNMVKVADDGSYVVTFFNKEPICVKPDELDGQIRKNGELKRSVSGDLGIKAIERAYAKMLKEEAERKKLIKFHDEATMFFKIDEGGYVIDAIKRLSGLKANVYAANKSSIYNVLDNIAATGANNHIIACSTPDKPINGDFVDPQYRFIAKHAYAIKDINPVNRTLGIVNPHNTKNTYYISWNEFSQYFDYLYDAMA